MVVTSEETLLLDITAVKFTKFQLEQNFNVTPPTMDGHTPKLWRWWWSLETRDDFYKFKINIFLKKTSAGCYCIGKRSRTGWRDEAASLLPHRSFLIFFADFYPVIFTLNGVEHVRNKLVPVLKHSSQRCSIIKVSFALWHTVLGICVIFSVTLYHSMQFGAFISTATEVKTVTSENIQHTLPPQVYQEFSRTDKS